MPHLFDCPRAAPKAEPPPGPQRLARAPERAPRWLARPGLRSSALAWLVAGCLAACAAPAGPDGLRLDKPVLLFGEVHDNAAQHAERLQAFQRLLAGGARPVLAMEQLDREKQPAIDALLRRASPPPTADEVIAAGGPSLPPGAPPTAGWAWDFYRPFIALALQHGLPIVAANVSRDDARRVMREGLAATGFDPAVPADVQASHVRAIVASHCGLVDEPTAVRMAGAQVARDQFMARVLAAHAARGVVLLAGNGHVRTDVGVPRWLPTAVRSRSLAIGWLERGAQSTQGSFDSVRLTAAHPRPDPCEGMRKSIPGRPAPATAR